MQLACVSDDSCMDVACCSCAAELQLSFWLSSTCFVGLAVRCQVLQHSVRMRGFVDRSFFTEDIHSALERQEQGASELTTSKTRQSCRGTSQNAPCHAKVR